ncbi:MAG: hypothetical protein ACYDBQ_09635, partial [Thermoplasmatota archaeon]
MATARSRLKRFFGTTLFVLAVAVAVVFGFILYANSANDQTISWAHTNAIPTFALVAGIVLGVIVIALFIILLIRGYDRSPTELDEREAFFIPENPSAPPPMEQDFSPDAPK